MVLLMHMWGGRFSAARRPEEMSLCVAHLGVSWPWFLVGEWCCVSRSRNDSDDVSLNRCVLVIRAGEGWRGWITRETETISTSVLSSYRGTVPRYSEETQEKMCRSVYPLSPKGHLSYGAFFSPHWPTVGTFGLHRGWVIVCTRNWNLLTWLVTRIECKSLCK